MYVNIQHTIFESKTSFVCVRSCCITKPKLSVFIIQCMKYKLNGQIVDWHIRHLERKFSRRCQHVVAGLFIYQATIKRWMNKINNKWNRLTKKKLRKNLPEILSTKCEKSFSHLVTVNCSYSPISQWIRNGA